MTFDKLRENEVYFCCASGNNQLPTRITHPLSRHRWSAVGGWGLATGLTICCSITAPSISICVPVVTSPCPALTSRWRACVSTCPLIFPSTKRYSHSQRCLLKCTCSLRRLQLAESADLFSFFHVFALRLPMFWLCSLHWPELSCTSAMASYFFPFTLNVFRLYNNTRLYN